MKQKHWVVSILLMGVLFLGACSGKEEAQVAGSSSNQQSNGSSAGEDLGEQDDDDTPQSAVQSSPLDEIQPLEAGISALPAIEGLEGGLLAVGDETLVYARFDGEPASLIHEEIIPFTVEALPNHRVGFIGRKSDGGRGDSLFVFNLESQEYEAEYPLTASGVIAGWSDDGNWLTLGEFQNNAQVTVVSADGSFQSEVITHGFDMAWLTDNTAIFMARDPDDNFNAYALRHFDPTTDTMTDLDIPITEDTNLNVSTYEVELAGLGYILSDNYLFFDRMDESEADRWFIPLPAELANNNQAVCATWNIQRFSREAGTFDIVQSFEDTHRLTDINVLDDDSVLVIRWLREGCTISSALEAELIEISPDGASRTVVDNILVDSNSVTNFNLERRYTVSADGRFVVWVSQQGGTLQDPALDMIDLETGSRLRLFSLAEGDDSVIRSVTWVE